MQDGATHKELSLADHCEIRPNRGDGRGYLVPAILTSYHGKVERHIAPDGDSYMAFPTLIEAEGSIREAGYTPQLQRGAASFPEPKVKISV